MIDHSKITERIFIAVPTMESVHKAALPGLTAPSNAAHRLWSVRPEGHSLLPKTFNDLLCMALNERRQYGWQYFVMHHSDLEAEVGFLDKLMDIYHYCRKTYDARVLSVTIPIKDRRGITSTGKRGQNKNIVRVTQHHLWGEPCLPDVFGVESFADNAEGDHLLINTGLMVFNLNDEWVEPWVLDEAFCLRDKVFKDPVTGNFIATCMPEDWGFSVYCHRHNIKVMATKAIKVAHHGSFDFPNWHKWGNWEMDEGDKKPINAMDNAKLVDAIKQMPLPESWKFPESVEGWLTRDEGEALAKLATGKTVLEIGSYMGKSTICMAQTAYDVMALDPFDGRGTPAPKPTLQQFFLNLSEFSVVDYVRTIEGTSESNADYFSNHCFELVFIDGAHDYASVQTDIALATKVLAPDGVLVFHDYRDRPGDHDGRWDPDVTKSVCELLDKGWRMVGRTGTVVALKRITAPAGSQTAEPQAPQAPQGSSPSP